MNRETNLKYFTAKGIKPLLTVGLILGAAGIVLLSRWELWELRPVGIVLVAAALVLLFIAFGKKVKDGDVDEGIEQEAKIFADLFVDRFITDHSRSSGIKVSEDAPRPKRRGTPQYFGSFWFTDVKHAKRGGDGKTRSSTYAFSAILIDPDQLSVGRRLLSLVEQKSDDVWANSPFAELERAELVDAPIDEGYRAAVRYVLLRITKKGGEIFAEIPLTADAEADNLVIELNRSIKRAQTAE